MRALLAAVAAAAMLGACAPAGSTPGRRDEVISPATARAVATTIVRAELQANQDLRPEDRDPVEPGAALLADRAHLEDLIARHGSAPVPPRVAVKEVVAPRQKGYPARFLAVFEVAPPDGSPVTYSLSNFTRGSGQERWRTDLNVDLPVKR